MTEIISSRSRSSSSNSSSSDRGGGIGGEPLTIKIFNSKNTLITIRDIEHIFKKIGIAQIPVYDITNYIRAFVHKSYCEKHYIIDPSSISNNHEHDHDHEKEKECLPLQSFSNERDEFFGDSLIGCIVGRYVYNRYDDQNEGFLTKMRTKIINGIMLAKLAKSIGFQKYVIVSKYVEETCEGRSSTSILEDSLEAFVGAVYLDTYQYALFTMEQHRLQQTNLLNKLNNKLQDTSNGNDLELLTEIQHYMTSLQSTVVGLTTQQQHQKASGMAFQQCEEFMVKLIEKFIDFEDLQLIETNYKEVLLKYFQKRFKTFPTFTNVSISGPIHNRVFTVSVHHVIENELLGMGEGRTKKEAQQLACKLALEKLGIETNLM